MRTINPTNFKNILRDLLNLDSAEGDARLDALIEMSVADVVDLFREDIGIATTYDSVIQYEASTDTESAKMYVVLPEDCYRVVSLFIGNIEIQPKPPSEFLKIAKASLLTSEPFIGSFKQQLDGQMIVDLYPLNSTLNGTTVDLVYRRYATSVDIIPMKYQKLLLYKVGMEYLIWDTKYDPGLVNNIRGKYKEEARALTMDQVYLGRDTTSKSKTLAEIRWEDSFNNLAFNRAQDFRR